MCNKVGRQRISGFQITGGLTDGDADIHIPDDPVVVIGRRECGSEGSGTDNTYGRRQRILPGPHTVVRCREIRIGQSFAVHYDDVLRYGVFRSCPCDGELHDVGQTSIIFSCINAHSHEIDACILGNDGRIIRIRSVDGTVLDHTFTICGFKRGGVRILSVCPSKDGWGHGPRVHGGHDVELQFDLGICVTVPLSVHRIVQTQSHVVRTFLDTSCIGHDRVHVALRYVRDECLTRVSFAFDHGGIHSSLGDGIGSRTSKEGDHIVVVQYLTDDIVGSDCGCACHDGRQSVYARVTVDDTVCRRGQRCGTLTVLAGCGNDSDLDRLRGYGEFSLHVGDVVIVMRYVT